MIHFEIKFLPPKAGFVLESPVDFGVPVAFYNIQIFCWYRASCQIFEEFGLNL